MESMKEKLIKPLVQYNTNLSKIYCYKNASSFDESLTLREKINHLTKCNNNKDGGNDKNNGKCYHCKTEGLHLKLKQIKTLTRITDELIETHFICADCEKIAI